MTVHFIRVVLWVLVFAYVPARSASLASLSATQVAEVQRGLYHTCVRFEGGGVKCWGNNDKGQLGTGNLAPSLIPVAVPKVNDASSLWVDSNATCVIRKIGRIACWGVNGRDEAVATSGDLNRATDIPSITDAVKISFGTDHVCALLRSGRVGCWGRNEGGQLGQGDTADTYWKEGDTVFVPLAAPARDLFTYGESSCALLDTGDVYCWGKLIVGSNRRTDNPVFRIVPWPSKVRGVANAIAISAGSAQCALIRTGQVRCWGDNRRGQLGDNTVRSRANAAPVLGLKGAKQLLWGMCAVLDDGRLACWGQDYGNYGNDNRPADDPNKFDIPTVAATTTILSGAKSYFLSYQDFCAVMPDGHVHCHRADSDTDLEVENLPDAVSISVNDGTGCALTLSRTVLCWGDSHYDLLGYSVLGNGNSNIGLEYITHPVATPVIGLVDP